MNARLGIWIGALATSITALAVLVPACSPVKYEDDDGSCATAKPLPPIVLVRDDLDIGVNDKVDCKVIKYFKDSVAKVEYRMGTAFEKHNIKGTLTLYNDVGQVLDQKAVDPSMFQYTMEFEVQANKPYYLELQATEGKYGYSAQVQFEPKKNPCDECTESQRCENGRCVDLVLECNPECDGDEGLLCENGVCTYQCEDRCRTKKGYACNVETRECERVVKRCDPRCKKDEVCNTRNGRCYPKREPQPKTCAGGCKPGEICKEGKCVELGAKTCPPCGANQVCNPATKQCVDADDGGITTGPIQGVLASTVATSGGTVLYLNRGNRHGVKPGATGVLCGKHRFVVTNVYPTRSKAKASASIAEIGDCKGFVIPR